MADAGMTGPHESVIGVVAESAIARMRTVARSFRNRSGRRAGSKPWGSCDSDSGRASAVQAVRVTVALIWIPREERAKERDERREQKGGSLWSQWVSESWNATSTAGVGAAELIRSFLATDKREQSP